MTPDDDEIPEWNIEELRRLDKQINEHEQDAILRRWEYGRHVLDGRGERARLPKGILDDLGAATGNSRRELQYRMKFAEEFPTDADMCEVLHLSWYEIIRRHLTAKPEPERQPTTEGPGKVIDGVTHMRASDVITGLNAWERNVFRIESIASYSEDSRLQMIRLLKIIADRLQNTR